MELSEEKYERLIRFMDLEMTEEEIAAFEKELRSDSLLREQLLFDMELRNTFLEKESSGSESDSASLVKQNALDGFVWWKPLAAASVIIFFSLLMVYVGGGGKVPVVVKKLPDTLLQKRPDSNLVKVPEKINDTTDRLVKAEALFKKLYRKPPPPDQYHPLLENAFELYVANDYSGFDRLDANSADELRAGAGEDINKIKMQLLFYKGIVEMERKNFKLAGDFFNKASVIPTDVFWGKQIKRYKKTLETVQLIN